MPVEQFIILLIVGLGAGVLSGLFGIGGGVIIVPALVLLGFQFKEAVGTSLGALLMPVGIFAVIAYYRAGKLRLSIAVWIALGLIAGGVVGAQIATNLDTSVLERLYGVFLLYTGWRFVEPRKLWREYRSETPTPKEETPAVVDLPWYYLLGVGLGAGVLAGMFGIGGGAVIVPALVGLLKFDQHLAVGTSLAALLLPVGLGSVLIYYNNGDLRLEAATMVALGLLIGALGGARIALGLPAKRVKQMYGVFLIILAWRFILGA
ncbi:MAG: sulfite exporter TauE/SafE family protein [Anaerolineae bacterium]|nr:sulfite exporter TauE/SafE family protein [Anaerolineae bacterium]